MASIYKIGVNLAMTSNAGGVLAVLSKQILGLHQSIGTLEKSLGRIGPALTAGLAAAGGFAIAEGLKTAMDHGKELLDQQDKLIRAGVTHAQVANLTADAYQRIAKQVPTATGADILRTVNQLRVVTGSLSKAEQEAPEALKIEALLENLTGSSAEGAGHALWRSLEMKGLTSSDDPKKQDEAQKLLYAMVQDIAASGGKLTQNDFLNAAKTGGAYWLRASPQFVAGPGAVAMADLGGERFGTALATFGQFMSGATTLSKQQYQALDSIGMINPKLVTTDSGGRVNMKPGAINGSLQYGDDPYTWVQKILIPALEKHGVKPGPVEDDILSKIGRNRNVTRMLTMFSDDGFVAQIAKDLKIFAEGMKLDPAYNQAVHNDPKMVDSAFDKQYQSMLQAIGAPLEQAAIPVMSAVTSMFTYIGAFAQKHPNLVKELGFDVVLGPMAYVGDLFQTLGTVLSPVGKYLAPIPGEAERLATSFAKVTGVLDPAAHAADTLANAIARLGADIEGAVKGLIGIGGKTWTVPSTAYQGKNPIHKESFVSPALSPRHGAALIHADNGATKTLVAFNALGASPVPTVSEAHAAAIHRLESASSNAVPKHHGKREVLVPITLTVDRRVLTKIVTKGQYDAAKMPLGIHGQPDAYGSFVGPGTTMQPT